MGGVNCFRTATHSAARVLRRSWRPPRSWLIPGFIEGRSGGAIPVSTGALDRVPEGRLIDDLTLVIPSHNEAGSIAQVIREWWEVRPRNAAMEILVVDDASADGTAQILNDLQGEIPVRIVRNSRPQGYGGSLRIGIRHTRTPWVAFTDGDGQYDPRDLKSLLEPLSRGSDISAGVRTQRADPAIRRFISFGFRMLLWGFFGLQVRDPTGSLKAGRTEAFQRVAERTSYMNASFWSEFMVRSMQRGLTYEEVPVHHLPRRFGESKVVSNGLIIKVAVQQLIALLRLWKELHRLEVGQTATAGVSS